MLLATVTIGACSQGLTLPTATTGLTTGATPPTATAPKRARPVVAGRAARVYVFAGFKEKTCEPVAVNVSVTTQPRQGRIEIRPGQTTTVMHSSSGNCIGKSMSGSGVYYTPNKDADGADSFAVLATTPTGGRQTKTFNLNVTQ